MTDKEFKCPVCGGSLSADESLQGLEAPCPHCQKTITIRFPESATEPEASVDNEAQSIDSVPQQPEGSTCSSCGTNMPKNARFCPNCGSSIPAKEQLKLALKRFCKGCGAAIERDATICVSCGLNQITGKSVATSASLQTPVNRTTLADDQSTEERSHNWFGKLFLLFVSVAICVAALRIIMSIDFSCSKRSRHESSAERFPNGEQLQKVQPMVTEMTRLGYRWGARDWCYWFRYAQGRSVAPDVLYDEFRAVAVYSPATCILLLPRHDSDPTKARQSIAMALMTARDQKAPIHYLYGYHQLIIDDMRANGW